MTIIKDKGIQINGDLFSNDFDELDKKINEEIKKEFKDDSDAEMEEKFGFNE